MPKTRAPLLSFGARGQIAETMVFSSWKGVAYAREYVVPANPNTAAQQETRNTFKWLQDFWRYSPALLLEAWDAYASGQPLTGRNAFGKFNISPLRNEADLTNFIMSPSVKSGPVAAGLVLTPGDDQIQCVLTAGTLPTGWTIDKAIFGLVPQQDPQSGVNFAIASGEDSTDPYDQTITGLQDATEYVVGGWFKYVRPDGTYAYGPALQDTATTT